MNETQLLGPVLIASVSLIAATISLVIGIINWRQSHRTYQAARETRIEDLYDRLMDYRLKHPEVFALSRSWKPECITKIYSQVNESEKSWAIYIGYVELCISYCNAVLHAWKRGQLDRTVYKAQHEPLMKLLLTEHYPIVRQLTREGGFVSGSIAEFLQAMRKKGWDWELEYSCIDQVR